MPVSQRVALAAHRDLDLWVGLWGRTLTQPLLHVVPIQQEHEEAEAGAEDDGHEVVDDVETGVPDHLRTSYIVKQSIGHSVSRSSNRSPINQSITQSIDQSLSSGPHAGTDSTD